MCTSNPQVLLCRRERVGHLSGLIVLGLLLASDAGCSSFSAQGRNSEGVRLFSQARYDEAMRQFQQAVYTSPSNADGYYNIASTYHRQGLLERRQADLDQAESYYNQCLDHDPNHRDCYRGLCVLLAEQSRSEEAFRLIEGWVGRQPNSTDAKIELARLCEEFGKRPEAKEHLIEALALEPSNPRALAALGRIREDMGDASQALRNYQQSLNSDRFQPQVASRIAALQAAGSPSFPMMAPGSPARMVDRGAAPLR